MKRTLGLGSVIALALVMTLAQSGASVVVSAQQADTSLAGQRALVNQYCMGCHSDSTKAGGFALSSLDLRDPLFVNWLAFGGSYNVIL